MGIFALRVFNLKLLKVTKLPCVGIMVFVPLSKYAFSEGRAAATKLLCRTMYYIGSLPVTVPKTDARQYDW